MMRAWRPAVPKMTLSPCSPNSVEEQVVHDRLEMSLHPCPRHALDGRRLPLGLLVLIDQQRAHALEEVVVGPHAMLRHAVLDGHRILERTVGAALELLQRDRHGHQRMFYQRCQLLLPPL